MSCRFSTLARSHVQSRTSLIETSTGRGTVRTPSHTQPVCPSNVLKGAQETFISLRSHCCSQQSLLSRRLQATDHISLVLSCNVLKSCQWRRPPASLYDQNPPLAGRVPSGTPGLSVTNYCGLVTFSGICPVGRRPLAPQHGHNYHWQAGCHQDSGH